MQQHSPDYNAEMERQCKATKNAQDLATYWQAMADQQRKELESLEARIAAYRRQYGALLGRYGALHRAARAVIQNAARDANYTDEVRVVGAAALDELARCVSSKEGDAP